MRGPSGADTAGWMFVAPAVSVIAVFFALPVVLAFALSFTDFDIYALATLKNLRFVGLGNYLRLLGTPLFWRALGNTLYFVVVGRAPVRRRRPWGRPCCSTRGRRGGRPCSAPPCSRPW